MACISAGHFFPLWLTLAKINVEMFHVKKVIRIGFVVAVVLVVLLFLSRNLIVKGIFNKVTTKIKSRYGVTVTVSSVKVKGISTFELQNLLVANSDTLLYSNLFKVRLNPFYLATLKINPKQVDISNSQLKVDKLIALAIKPRPESSSSQNTSQTLGSKRLYRLVRAFFGLTTATFNIDNLLLAYSDSTYHGNVKIAKWNYHSNNFTSTVNLNDGGSSSWVRVAGATNKRNSSLTVTLSADSNAAFIPFTSPILGIKSSFKKIYIDLKASHNEPDKIELSFNSNMHSLMVEGNRIAQTPVTLDSCGVSLLVRVMPNSYIIDTISTLNLNGFRAYVGLEYYPYLNRRLMFKLYTGDNKWQSFFDALPQGLFTNLNGIKVNGTFSYSLQVDIPLATPDSLTITPNLRSKGFYVLSYGNTNLAMLADTFTHRAYIDNVFVRDIKVNPKSEVYASLDQISPYLQWAVITSEDGGFYNHRGFSLEGITYAMACNIREKRFVRGGSTISQQLVKNIFLNQNKNIGRKAEEILITWIIENTGIATKERILEVYLNIIEWGPNVFGIREACQYYFGKSPISLTLPEALFLAFIIPRPTKFHYLFDAEGKPKQFVTESFLFVANKMLTRGNITQKDYDNLVTNPQVTLTGPAKDLPEISQ